MSDDPTSEAGTIPGLTKQGERVLRLVVREEMRGAIDELFKDERCPRPCRSMLDLQRVVFGRAELGVVGMDERINGHDATLESIGHTLEAIADDRRWMRRAVIGAILSAVGALAVALILLAANAG